MLELPVRRDLAGRQLASPCGRAVIMRLWPVCLVVLGWSALCAGEAPRIASKEIRTVCSSVYFPISTCSGNYTIGAYAAFPQREEDAVEQHSSRDGAGHPTTARRCQL